MSAAVAEIIGAEFVEAARTLMPKQVVESLVAEILSRHFPRGAS
jgi:hypothetical protein